MTPCSFVGTNFSEEDSIKTRAAHSFEMFVPIYQTALTHILEGRNFSELCLFIWYSFFIPEPGRMFSASVVIGKTDVRGDLSWLHFVLS